MHAEEHNNCGITVFRGFDSVPPLSYKALAQMIEATEDFGYGNSDRNKLFHFNIVNFSINNQQTAAAAQFVTWLRRRGEKIIETKWVLNHNSGRKIKSFMWVPSWKFKQLILKEMRKLYPPDRRNYWLE